jgi:hypothetical protein
MPDLNTWPTDGAAGSVSSEAKWRKMARLWVPSGVASAADLVPTLAAGPTINVAVGAAWLDGHFAELTTPASIPASANGLLVLRFTPADNRCELLYRDGATTPTQTDPTWEMPVALMNAGSMYDRRAVLSLATELASLASAPATITAVFPALTAIPGVQVNLWATGLYLCTACFDVNVTTLSAGAQVYGHIVPNLGGIDNPLAAVIQQRTMMQMTAVQRFTQTITVPVRCTTAGTGYLTMAGSKSAAAGAVNIESGAAATWLHVHRIAA